MPLLTTPASKACESVQKKVTDNPQSPKTQTNTPTMPAAAAGQDNSEAHSREQRSKLAAGLRDLADRLEQQPELMSRAADLMSQDFMDNRAPPPQVGLLPLVLYIIHLA